MRFTHVVRSFTAIATVSLAAWIVGIAPASAVTISSPTEGQIVRDKVRIVVPRSSLSPDVATSMGFVAIKVDGRFISAVGVDMATTKSKTGEPVIVYTWDTKAPITGTNMPEDQRYYRDGEHEIIVEGHGPGPKGDTIALEKIAVKVVLKNKIPQPNPAPPMKLRYTYHFGQQTKYKVNLSGEVLSIAGVSLSGGQAPILAQYAITQAVEDVQRDGSAMLRYKVNKDEGFTQLFGNVVLLAQTGQPFKSVYKVIDKTGRTLEENVLSTKSEAPVTDCLVWLPSRAVQVGESWPTSTKLKIEGVTDIFTLSGMSTFDSLEWENGHKCAKIVSRLTGQPNFGFLPGISGPVDVIGVSYFAYDLGKVIVSTYSMELNTTLDDATISSLQQKVDAPNQDMSGSPSGSSSRPPRMPGGPGMMPGMSPGSFAGRPSGPGSSSGPGTPGAGGKSVKVRLTITQESI